MDNFPSINDKRSSVEDRLLNKPILRNELKQIKAKRRHVCLKQEKTIGTTDDNLVFLYSQDDRYEKLKLIS